VSAEPSPITTYFRVCDGVRVRYADTRSDSDITVLMLAPWPESLWAFRRIWQRVTALGRVVAIDMPGFGHSDQSREELIAPDGSWHASSRSGASELRTSSDLMLAPPQRSSSPRRRRNALRA
jgi:pimeloyl-ACP methyl ester carboxylesterase